jgi:hypothetical protein
MTLARNEDLWTSAPDPSSSARFISSTCWSIFAMSSKFFYRNRREDLLIIFNKNKNRVYVQTRKTKKKRKRENTSIEVMDL